MALSPSGRVALEKLVLAVVVYSIIGFGYLIVNHIVEGRVLHELWTPIDRAWPFDQRFIWPYLLVFVTPLSILLFVPELPDIRRAGLALLTNAAVVFPIFVAFPVTLPRPEERLRWDASGYITDFIWQLDRPINCFPSLHVCLAFSAGFIVRRFHRAGGLLIFASAIAISVSTLYTRQHYVLDIVAGILVGAGSYWLAFVRDVAGRSVLIRAGATSS